MKELTPRQRNIFEFLIKFIKKHGYPPTVREIGGHFGFLWPAARGHLQALERKGFIRINPLRSRGIEVKGIKEAAGLTVPVIGKVTAGKPILAVEDIEGHMLIDKTLFKAEEAFSLRIKGESMIEAGILDGDYVIVKPQTSIESGEIAVALIGDEATVKRIYIKKAQIILKPENKDMKPIAYNPDSVKIIGKVIGVVRKI
ncbi:MAG: repressor LexA [Nitrospirae bacterium]|nr:repressor LexA [Nitrospirota bacterium]